MTVEYPRLTIPVELSFIVNFCKKVRYDFHCQYPSEDYSWRYDTLEQAEAAAIAYCNMAIEKPYYRSATVFNGWLIVCPVLFWYERKCYGPDVLVKRQKGVLFSKIKFIPV